MWSAAGSLLCLQLALRIGSPPRLSSKMKIMRPALSPLSGARIMFSKETREGLLKLESPLFNPDFGLAGELSRRSCA